MVDMDTTGLLQQAREGSDEALDALLQRHAGKLLAVVRVRLGPSLRGRVESGDVLQECLIKAYQRFGQFEGEDRALMAWLARIAENQVRDEAEFHGRQRRDVRQEVALEDGAGALAARARSVSSQVALGQQTRQLERALETLEPDHREVIVLRKLHELGFREIGERMERSEDAARMLLARAMTALTLAMGSDG
jgi:RNA polymerase sigma-70 factor, ECF subfamily